MAQEESKLSHPIPSIKAICVRKDDPWRQILCDELHINEEYTPEYLIIGRSYSYLCVREFPKKEYNAIMFELKEEDGRILDFRVDFIRPIMERYKDYLFNEMNLTGTWEVYVKLNEHPIISVPPKNKYKIVQYGSFNLENKRMSE